MKIKTRVLLTENFFKKILTSKILTADYLLEKKKNLAAAKFIMPKKNPYSRKLTCYEISLKELLVT